MELDAAIAAYVEDKAPAPIATQVLSYFRAWFEQTTGEALTLANWTRNDTREWVYQYLSNIYKKPNGDHLSANTVNSYLRQLRAFAHWCVDNDLMQRDPTAKVKEVRIQKKPVQALDRNEENKLLRELEQEDPIYRFIILFLLHTGLRASELVGLELTDVQLGESGTTLDTLLSSVPKPEAFRSGVLTVRRGKGMKERDVELNATAREALLEYLRVRPRVESNQLLISLKTREPMTYAGVHYACEKYRTRTGIHLRPHRLRDAFGTKVYQATQDIKVVADLLGHGDINITAKYYLTNDAARRKSAVERIEGD